METQQIRLQEQFKQSSKRPMCKWDLKHYTVANNDVRELNPHELKATASLWRLGIDGLSLRDHMAFLEHLQGGDA